MCTAREEFSKVIFLLSNLVPRLWRYSYFLQQLNTLTALEEIFTSYGFRSTIRPPSSNILENLSSVIEARILERFRCLQMAIGHRLGIPSQATGCTYITFLCRTRFGSFLVAKRSHLKLETLVFYHRATVYFRAIM